MGGLLTYGDGRLKTGRITWMAFTALLVCAGMLFKVSAPVDRAMVAVKHVFEAQESQPPVEQKSVVQQTDNVRTAEPHRSEKKKLSQPVEAESPGHKQEKSAQQVREDKRPQPKVDRLHELRQAQTQVSEPVSGEMKHAAKEKEKVRPVETAEHVSHAEAVPPERLAEPSEQKQTSDLNPGLDVASLTEMAADDGQGRPNGSQKIDLDVSGKLDHLSKWAENPEKKEGSGISEGMSSLINVEKEDVTTKQTSKKKPETDSRMERATRPNKSAGPKPLDADRTNRAITVDAQDYMTLFHGWRNSGNPEKGKSKIPLRVENLRAAYGLFQMKPVAVVRNKIFIDLTDGTTVPEQTLEDYSSTVFRVNAPWAKWEETLSAAGIRRTDDIEVRYYMYDFVRNAIFTRANAAFNWLKEQGLIGQDSTPEGVDVFGRAYVIKQQGGGCFGVFVPVSVDTEEGRSVAIDPACFAGQTDIETLRTAGLL